MNTDETSPVTPEDVLAEEIAKANEVRRDTMQTAEAEYDRDYGAAKQVFDTAIEAAAGRYEDTRAAAERTYTQSREAAVAVFQLGSTIEPREQV